jgi:hypothetical protein
MSVYCATEVFTRWDNGTSLPSFLVCLTKWPQRGVGADIVTANMYLAEDRVHGECDMDVVGLCFVYNALIDVILGTGLKARRGMDASLCQFGLPRYGHTGSGAGLSTLERISDLMFPSGSRIGLAASQMAQWVVLHCDTQHSQVPRSPHSFVCNFLIHVELVYQTFNLICFGFPCAFSMDLGSHPDLFCSVLSRATSSSRSLSW